jgi:predicted branched-subunit amino acid permease
VTAETAPASPDPADEQSVIVRDALGIAVATAAYGLSFGALATAAGLSVLQTCVLSLLMFTGASQFALIGILGGGGSTASGVATAALLGARNVFYGVRMTSLLRVRGLRKLVATQLVIDETTAMAVVRSDPRAARRAFYVTGAILFGFWNVATLLGALGGNALSDPGVLGLDAAAPAAFLALLAPQVRSREPVRPRAGSAPRPWPWRRRPEAAPGDWPGRRSPEASPRGWPGRRRPEATAPGRSGRQIATRLAGVRANPLGLLAVAGAGVAVVLTPLVPAGVPVLAAGAVAVLVGLARPSAAGRDERMPPPPPTRGEP